MDDVNHYPALSFISIKQVLSTNSPFKMKKLKYLSASLLFVTVLLAGQSVFAQIPQTIEIPMNPGDPEDPIEPPVQIVIQYGYDEPAQTAIGFFGDRNVNDGKDVSYTYEPTTHALTISGTGSMMLMEEDDETPWHRYANCIRTVEIGSGVTTITSFAFSSCINLETVTISNSVISIGESAFYDCNNLTSVTIDGESHLETIGDDAFSCCFNLSSIDIPASVTTIGRYAFGYCESLSNAEIPAGLTNIGAGAFAGCSGVSSISLAQGNVNFRVQDGVLFNNDGTELVCYPAGKSDVTYTVPAGVIIIDDGAFSSCVNLVSVIFEVNSQLTTIGEDAFYGCGKIESITIPASVSNIGDYAFENCSELATIAFDDASKLVYIGQEAFDGTIWFANADEVIRLGSILYRVKDSFAGSYEISNDITVIAKGAFYECDNLTAVTIPASVTTIMDNAFDGCSSLASVSFTGNSQLTTIGSSAFAYTYISSIHIPAGVTDIDYSAFDNCNELTTVVFDGESHLTEIKDFVFNCCAELTEITIPSTVTSIGNYAFGECGSLATVIFEGESQLAYIGPNSFSNCTSLSGIVIPSGVIGIGAYAFYSCNNLENVTFAANSQLTNIGESAFCYTDITTITIPSGVDTIGEEAFESCGNLETVYVLPVTPPAINNSFNNLDDNCRFYLHGIKYGADNDWHDYVIDKYNCTVVYSLALGEGITATPAPVIANNNRGYYTENTEITLSGGDSEVPEGCDPNRFMGYTLNRIPHPFGNDFEMPAEDVRAEAFWMPLETAGSGTEDDPYVIVYPCQLDLIALSVNSGNDLSGLYFKLGNDISYSYEGYGPTESNFTPIGTIELDFNAPIITPNDPNDPNDPIGPIAIMPIFNSFNGTFDGNGKTISGIRLYTNGGRVNDMCQSIFNIVGSSGVVKNLTVEDTKITAPMGGGGIAGIVNGGLIENCISYADINVNKPFMGQGMGIAGGIADQTQGGRITDCVSYSTITVEDDAEDFGVIGGIVGGNAGYVENCHSYASINIGDNAEFCEKIGGVVGDNMTGYIDNCYSYASISIGNNADNCREFGGISGASSEGCITDCFSSVTIEVGDNPATVAFFGGIVGCIDEDVVDGNIVVDVTLPDLNDVGAILGCYSSCLLMSNNYYSNCTVGVRSNNIGWFEGDLTQNDGAVQATILIDTEDAPTTLANGEKVVYRREFKQGVSSTVCLPVAIDAAQASAAGKFFTFAGVDMTDPDDWAVVMQEVAGNMVAGDLEANTPYLFIPDADGPVMFVVEADGSSVAAGSAVDGNWTFAGTYDSIVWNAGNANLGKVYGFAAQKYEAPDGDGDSNPDYTINPGKFVMAGAGACIAPYRAYLTYNAPQNAPSRTGSRASQQLPGSMKVILLGSNGVETAVGRIDAATGNVSIDTWYDMNGRQIDGAPAKGGMYIHGGKTIMINK